MSLIDSTMQDDIIDIYSGEGSTLEKMVRIGELCAKSNRRTVVGLKKKSGETIEDDGEKLYVIVEPFYYNEPSRLDICYFRVKHKILPPEETYDVYTVETQQSTNEYYPLHALEFNTDTHTVIIQEDTLEKAKAIINETILHQKIDLDDCRLFVDNRCALFEISMEHTPFEFLIEGFSTFYDISVPLFPDETFYAYDAYYYFPEVNNIAQDDYYNDRYHIYYSTRFSYTHDHKGDAFTQYPAWHMKYDKRCQLGFSGEIASRVFHFEE